jgi:hypothetical protein
MTIREQLNQKYRRVWLGTFIIWVVLGLLLSILSPDKVTFSGTVLKMFETGIVFFFIGISICAIYAVFGIRCPKCHRATGCLVPSLVKYCPYCGIALELDTRHQVEG